MAKKQGLAPAERRDVAADNVGSRAMPQVASTHVREMYADALSHHHAGRMADAERLYRRILQIDSRHADSLHLLGVLAHAFGRNDVAVALIGQAIGINDKAAAFHYNLGIALRELGRVDDAIATYRSALCVQPDFAEAHSNLGLALKDLGRVDDAVAAYRSALRAKADFAEAHSNLGIALYDLGRLNDAVATFGTALCIRPDFAEAHFKRGLALKDLGCHDGAVAAFRTALRTKPDFAEAHSNMGIVLKDQGRLDDAVAAYYAALCVRPDSAEAHSNLGIALLDLGRLDDAVAAYGTALRIKPDFVEAHYNLANALLLAGRFKEGWPEYEWRWEAKKVSFPKRRFLQPVWQGERLEGRTVLLHAEQGMGDAIQFCRYVPLVVARGGRVVLEVYRPLGRLLGRLAGVDRLVAKGDELPSFDLHCPLLSLPRAFDTRVETIPAQVPYLEAEPDRVAVWRDRLPSSGFRVGIAWQGSPTYEKDHDRSAPLACFSPLSRVPGVHLISLQKVHGLDQLEGLPDGMDVETLGGEFDEGSDAFIDTAAIMMSLHLIVTVDSAIGHLAGALGRPVWLPLTTVPHWPWLLGREDTPWYPKTRLFRQSKRGEWHDVFERMAVELGSIVK